MVLVSSCMLEEVNDREDDNPDEANELPLKPGNHNLIEGPVAAEDRCHEERAQVNDSRKDVKAMEASAGKKGRAKKSRFARELLRQAPGGQALVKDQLVVLVDLNAEKDDSSTN